MTTPRLRALHADDPEFGSIVEAAAKRQWDCAWRELNQRSLDPDQRRRVLGDLCYQAIRQPDPQAIRCCIEQGLDPNTVLLDRAGRPLALMAVPLGLQYRMKHHDAVRCLVELGATAQQAQENGCAIVALALATENEEMIRLMFQTGATLYHPSEPASPALFTDIRIMDLLRCHGARPEHLEQWPWIVDPRHDRDIEAMFGWMRLHGYSLDAPSIMNTPHASALETWICTTPSEPRSPEDIAFACGLVRHGARLSGIDMDQVRRLDAPVAHALLEAIAERTARDLDATTPCAAASRGLRRV